MTEIDSVVGNFKEGFLLKMKKGMTGAKYWKKHWVYADSDMFFQWQSSAKPVNGESPKYSCTLKDCKIEESQIRQFAFKITAIGSSESMIYAADDFDTYESWLKILFGDASYSEIEKIEDKSEIASTAYSEEFQQFTSDKIADFFYEHNISMEPRCPMITEKDLRKLLLTLDSALNTTNTIGVILHDLRIKQTAPLNGVTTTPTKGGATVSYDEFKQWWSTHSYLFIATEKSTINDDINSGSSGVFQNVDGADSVLFVGLQTIPLSTNSNRDFLYKARVPKYSTYEQFVAPRVQAVSDDVNEPQQSVDWNEHYQSAREAASISQSYHLQSEDETALTEVWTNYRVSPPVEEEGKSPARRDRTESAESAESTHKVGPLHTPDEAVRACLTLATTLGEFYQTALEGAKLLVDEFSLPLRMKSTPKVTADTDTSDVLRLTSVNSSDNSPDSASEDLFEHRGLLLRLVATNTTDADRLPDSSRQKDLVTNDELLYKRATAELRTSNACLGALETLYTDYQTTESWKKPQASVSGSSSPKKASKFKHFLRPSVLLNTLVDYGGFCVQVFSPTHIAEQFTLVHGFSSVPILPPAPPAEGESDRGEERETPPEDLGHIEVFVNSLPAYRSVLAQLAGALNVKLSRRLLNVTTASIFDSEDTFSSVHAELLSAELQAHKSADDRLYMLNFGGVFPSDLPREFSFDAVYRQLRPEFARNHCSQPVPCGPIFVSIAAEEEDADDDIDRRSAQESALSACSYLYTTLIPGVARTLDALSDLVPCDSHELTQYLHSRGLNMRHIGLLHSLCRTPCVRLLLLTECVARACKSLLRQALRRIARQCRSESLAAEQRGRSKAGDFIELMDLARARRKQAVLDLFNLVFAFPLNGNSDSLSQGGGSRSSSEEFWRGALLQTISQKFGVDLEQVMGPAGSSKRLSTLLHLPQLFLAVQYHTNCRFKDIAFSHVFSGGGSSLFVVGDILECCLPSCDGQQSQALRHIPGELGRIASNTAEEFLASGLYSEATQAFQLRLTLLATLNCTRYDDGQVPHAVLSLRQEAVFADVIYKLALSQYCNKQFNEAAVTVRHHYLTRHTQYSAASGRMLTLLMCIEQRCGRADRVRAYFDAAQCVYTYALSVHHPIIAMHMCALADLYQRDGGLKQARAMLVLARSVGGKALGEHHQVNAALACKLAVLHMNDGQYKEAAQLLSNALSIFDGSVTAAELESSGAIESSATRKLDEQIVDCLCALTESLARCEELDLAIHSGFRCIETCTKMLSSPTRTFVERKCNEARLSCLLVLSDLFVQKSELDSAFGLLHEAWTALQSSVTRRGSGRALAALACRILELMVSTLPMQTRSHFESVSDEALLSVDLTSSVWDRANTVVCSAMWSQKPADYLASVIHGIQRQEFDEKKVNKKEDHVSFSLQAAVISRFIKNPQEFSQQLISF